MPGCGDTAEQHFLIEDGTYHVYDMVSGQVRHAEVPLVGPVE